MLLCSKCRRILEDTDKVSEVYMRGWIETYHRNCCPIILFRCDRTAGELLQELDKRKGGRRGVKHSVEGSRKKDSETV